MAQITSDNRGLRLTLRYAVLVIIAAIFSFPLIFMVMSSLKPSEQLLADAHSPLMEAKNDPPASAYVHDPRIKAAVVVAPGLGFTFAP